MIRILPGLALSLAFSGATLAQESGNATVPTAELDTIVVTGEQPGPGLWKVSKDDHVLWVLGVLAPLPKKMDWQSREVEQRIAESQVLLSRPTIGIKTKLGFWGSMALLPSMVGIRNNPEDKRLADVVPSDVYVRWQPLKQRYLGRNSTVEKWRPLFAAMELYDAAIRRNDMTIRADAIEKALGRMAKRAGLKPTAVDVIVEIEASRKLAKEFKNSTLDDLECFRKTIDRLGVDLDNMKLRANAWATGDLEALRALPYEDQFTACAHAIQSATVMRDAGDLKARAKTAWLGAATTALETHAVSFAVLPMSDIVNSDGYLAALRELGMQVQAPDEQDEPSDSTAEPGSLPAK